MTPHEYVVWEWLNQAGVPRYVGNGRITGRKHPAERLWDERFSVNSRLHNWLRTLDAEPRRSNDVPRTLMHRQGARAVCTARKNQMKELDVELLSPRPFGTTLGGGSKRAVLSPEGIRYESVRSAARLLGLNQGTITRYCNNKEKGWRYER
jgi:hypothetical protein